MSVTRRRLLDWDARLLAFVEARRAQPFAWGVSDCCLFACDAILEISGEDPAAWFRGRYSDVRGAAAALREFSDGGTLGDVAARLARELGRDEIALAFASRGDCVLIDGEGAGHALAIVLDHRIVAQGPAGLVFLDRGAVLRAWAV